MEKRKAKMIRHIDRLLSDNELLKKQRQTLQAFDRFNELEARCRLGTRLSYLQTCASGKKWMTGAIHFVMKFLWE